MATSKEEIRAVFDGKNLFPGKMLSENYKLLLKFICENKDIHGMYTYSLKCDLRTYFVYIY